MKSLQRHKTILMPISLQPGAAVTTFVYRGHEIVTSVANMGQ